MNGRWTAVIGAATMAVAMLAGQAGSDDATLSPNPTAAALLSAIEAAIPKGVTAPECAGNTTYPASALVLQEGRVTGARLLAEMQGYAKAAGTTGGLGHKLITVTTREDYDPRKAAGRIAGSLRAAVEQARRDGGGWITFDPAALGPNARIELVAAITLPPNTTLDGGCTDVTLTAEAGVGILVIFSDNVVVTRLALHKRGPYPVTDEQDCITVGNRFDRIYIAHNDFGHCGDGQIDIYTRIGLGGKRHASIAFNRFTDHDKVMIVGTGDCYVARANGPCGDVLRSPETWHPEILTTLFGNLFLNTGQRHPRIAGHAAVHLVNNVIAFTNHIQPSGHYGSTYGVFVGVGGRLLAEDNLVFRSHARKPNIPLAIWTTNAPHALGMPADSPGAISATRTLTAGPEIVFSFREALVTALPYRLEGQQLRFDKLSPNEAAQCVVARAGRGGANGWPQGCFKE